MLFSDIHGRLRKCFGGHDNHMITSLSKDDLQRILLQVSEAGVNLERALAEKEIRADQDYAAIVAKTLTTKCSELEAQRDWFMRMLMHVCKHQGGRPYCPDCPFPEGSCQYMQEREWLDVAVEETYNA